MPSTTVIGGPAIVKSRPRRWFEALRASWFGPLTSKSPELVAAMGGASTTTAGIRVNEQNAFMFSAVFDAVNQIASDVAKLPLNLRKRNADGGSDPYTESRVYRLLKTQPNPEMGSMVFRRTLQAHALTWTGAYAEIERNDMGQPVALWPLAPNRVKVDRDRRQQLIYRVTNPSGDETILPPSDVLHVTGLGFDPHCGYSTVQYARQAIGLALATEMFAASFFGNGATFGGILSALGIQSEEEAARLRTVIEGRHQGPDASHKILVTWGDMKYEPNGVAPQNAQMNELRSKQVEEVARFFNMPVHKLKNLDRATNNNIEQQDLEYYKGCLLTWITLWEEELNRKLISPLEAGRQFFKHNVNAFLRGDTVSRTALYTALLDRGVFNADMVLELEDLNPQPNGQGQIYLVQGAMVPKDQLVALNDARIERLKAPKPAPQVPPPPASDMPGEDTPARMLAALVARAEAAEAVAREAQAQLTAERDARIASDSLTQGEREAFRQREAEALQRATAAELVASETRREVAHYQAQFEAAAAARTEAERIVTDHAARLAQAEQAVREAQAAVEVSLASAAEAEGRASAAAEAVRQAEGDAATAQRTADEARAALDEALARSAAEAETIATLRASVETAEQARREADAKAAALVAQEVARAEEWSAVARAAEDARMALAEALARETREAETIVTLRASLETAEQARREADAKAAEAVACEATRAAERAEAQRAAEDARSEAERLASALALAQVQLAEAQAAERASSEAAAKAAGEAVVLRASVGALEAQRDRLAAEVHSASEARVTVVMQYEQAAAVAKTLEDERQAVNAALAEAKSALAEANAAEDEACASVIAAHHRLVVHVMRGAIERESDRARRNQQTPDKLRAWLETWYDSHAELMTAALVPAVTVHLAWIRSTDTPGDVVRDLVAEHIAESKRQIEAVVDGDAGDLARSLAQLLHRWESERVTVLADRLMQKELDYAKRRHAA